MRKREKRRAYSFHVRKDEEVLGRLDALATARGMSKMAVLRMILTHEWWRHENGLGWRATPASDS
jgi:predicted transcriptional regulator